MAYTKADLSKLNPDTEIELWIVDLRIWGGPVKRYHNMANTNVDDELDYGGNAYEAIPIQGNGFDYDGKGPMPTPSVIISNIEYQVTALAQLYRRFTACPITRIRTLRKHLDDGSDPDTSSQIQMDIFTVENISRMDDVAAEIQLSTNLAALRAQIPQDVVDAPRFPGTAYAGHV